MNTATATFVGADIDAQTWQRASAALAAMGMTAADAIRLTMSRIAEEGRMPFVSRAPVTQESATHENWHEEVLAIGRRNGVTRADVDALMQAISELDEPIADPKVFEE